MCRSRVCAQLSPKARKIKDKTMGPVKQRAALDDRAADGAQYKNEGVRLLRMVTAMDEADCVLATAMDQARDHARILISASRRSRRRKRRGVGMGMFICRSILRRMAVGFEWARTSHKAPCLVRCASLARVTLTLRNTPALCRTAYVLVAKGPMENRFVIADEYIITLIVPAKPMNSWACGAKRIA